MTEERIRALFTELLRIVKPKKSWETFLSDHCRPLDDAVTYAVQDASSYLARDPALHGSWDAVLAPGSSFRATATYRLAHLFWYFDGSEVFSHAESRALALALSYAARRETGVEIHPAAKLGPNFVVDHGYGTVIGETVQTGSDCYILNAVTLGSRGIAGNPTGRRHPILGDRVEIGSFACVFGPVTIGSDVFIGPHCMVSDNICSGMNVTIKQPLNVRPNSTQLNSIAY